MSGHFRYIVVGCGMMGAAAARHLAETVDGVALIGPGEPADIKSHRGVYASHYDEARITRTIDGDVDWALLANRSIARYADIAARSGVEFYAPVGCLMVGPERGGDNPFVDDVRKAAARLGVSTELLGGESLKSRFPYFSFEQGSEGVFERDNAGYVNPRGLVRAQAVLAEKAGVALIDDIVVSTLEEDGRARVETASGAVYTADRVLVAAGGFSITKDLLPQPVALDVYARTVAFFEVDEGDLDQYADMPSLIYEPRDTTKHIYLLPPVRYPDGKFYLKIGGDPDDKRLGSDPEIREWFRSGGRESVRDHLSEIVGSLVPSIDLSRVSMAACVVSKTQSGYPAIGFTASPKIAVLTGGNGTAAKSSDEIGRLGAVLLRDGKIADGAFATDFKPAFL
ncbi:MULTISPECIES: FAD-dependent oxidoreductase [unclassified Agrobacterium]|uniref:FAD-dependent oxidoreductase n=1 Tax=unclassified Agrobacterium TaxID=2632611 RepID=UPI00244BE86F|nr:MULTISPECIES: FAD-dependent oxidoreductase [unclassified Agrobacterium]MDH0613867.1 FAD-dependent oxidoreductase [Agrobacterium sp. GD03872]MDH0696756.1 FAD-dependent oxidoreductase [Agrobacterium sp. GD03871]MDH1060080.1 FAD-dependent oxidoreductase [Agrobacterium sp. GD03992]MDH2209993.1 FAD-dependent oxidoreductase [Agrobacterium sp. GD03643]MDH2219492.1 FAD-dependent oxidoreductase [Agrobacterium sp. GD03638]